MSKICDWPPFGAFRTTSGSPALLPISDWTALRSRAASGRHPLEKEMWRASAIAMLATCDGSEPSRGGTGQCGHADHECQDHCAPPRALDVIARTRDHLGHALFGVGRGQPGTGGDQTNKVGPIVVLQAAVAFGCQQNARGFGACVADVAFDPPLAAKQPIEILGDEVFASDGS